MWNLLLMRHAHAEDAHPDGDLHRLLKNKGKRNAQRMGVWLDQNHLRPDLVFASPATRALITAEKCCKSAGLSASLVSVDDTLYGASLQTLRSFVEHLPAKPQTVLMVGHNPGMAALYESLLDGAPELSKKGKVMPPGTLAHFTVSGDGFAFEQVIFPKTLPRKFPWPDCSSAETRIRPAYYYSQSAAIPWREGDNGLEVLIISSSRKSHWGVPKGVHEPGLSAAESAAQEALEEAGALGKVSDKAIGAYSYEKWEALCRVDVYPMQVTGLISEADWEESSRDRAWVPLAEAVQKVRNKDLAALIQKLPEALEQEDDL